MTFDLDLFTPSMSLLSFLNIFNMLVRAVLIPLSGNFSISVNLGSVFKVVTDTGHVFLHLCMPGGLWVSGIVELYLDD